MDPLGVTLNIPSFLAEKDQLSQEEVTESQTIAAVRIHVERAIQRIKYFRQIRNKITSNHARIHKSNLDSVVLTL